VAYWAKFPTNALPGDLPFFCSAINSYGNAGLTFAPSYKAGGWSWSLGDGATYAGVYGAANSINNGQWHHMVHTFNRATGQGITYLDGTLVNTTGFSILDNIDSGNGFSIGQDPTGAYQESGSLDMDDLGVWRRVLSPLEAYNAYYSGKTYGRSFDVVAPVTMQIVKIGADNWIVWQGGTLLQSDDVDGTYTPVSGASAPYYMITPTQAKKFFKVKL
jgi:hypothetical protein